MENKHHISHLLNLLFRELSEQLHFSYLSAAEAFVASIFITRAFITRLTVTGTFSSSTVYALRKPFAQNMATDSSIYQTFCSVFNDLTARDRKDLKRFTCHPEKNNLKSKQQHPLFEAWTLPSPYSKLIKLVGPCRLFEPGLPAN